MQRENAATASPAPGAHATLSNASIYTNGPNARTIVYRAGLPEAAQPFVQLVLDLEGEIQKLRLDVEYLMGRLATLESKR